ncbi:MAG: TetR/AcrR family transcriptional regulator [Acidimicrobiia bacterium]|nr:TetR/AcrR family transcriptional regulator [Acidimicrobiia bacterium]MDH4306473.1 TetR/AcrR family transcriptional regulator [Acidimicrobiia bacterium]MDH5292943.1 TetR/AcrR family transcriptional regulator [Acidimicrobiia bacterium]
MRNRAGLETRQKILDATRSLLSERGLEGTTVKAVCDRASVRAGSFYNLFDSKEQVVMAVMREAIQAVDPDPEGTGDVGVGDLIEAYISYLGNDPALARVYLLVAINGSLTDEDTARRIARHHADRTDRFVAAMRHDRPELAATEIVARVEALLAALNGYTMQALLDPSFDFAAHARRLLTMEPAGDGA